MARFIAPGCPTNGLIKRGNIDIDVLPVSRGRVVLTSYVVPLGNPLFTHEGPDQYARAFAHNRRFAKPGPYQTHLSAEKEQQFRAWLARWRIPFDPNAKVVDYDMRGYWLASHGTAVLPAHAPGSHFPDTFKTPYDTTFSRESKYATPDNPFEWNGDQLIDRRNRRTVFSNTFVLTPTRSNLGQHYGWFNSQESAHAYGVCLHHFQAHLLAANR